MAAFYENITTPWSADKYVGLCSIATTSRVGGGQRKRLVYTSTSSRLYIHVVNVTSGHSTDDHVLLRYDGRFHHVTVDVTVAVDRNQFFSVLAESETTTLAHLRRNRRS